MKVFTVFFFCWRCYRLLNWRWFLEPAFKFGLWGLRSSLTRPLVWVELVLLRCVRLLNLSVGIRNKRFLWLSWLILILIWLPLYLQIMLLGGNHWFLINWFLAWFQSPWYELRLSKFVQRRAWGLLWAHCLPKRSFTSWGRFHYFFLLMFFSLQACEGVIRNYALSNAWLLFFDRRDFWIVQGLARSLDLLCLIGFVLLLFWGIIFFVEFVKWANALYW